MSEWRRCEHWGDRRRRGAPPLDYSLAATRRVRRRSPKRILALVVCRWWLAGLLCAALGAACGDESSGSSSESTRGSTPYTSSTSSLPADAVRRLVARSRLVAAAYRAFSDGYVDCFNKLDAGVLQTTADFASCTDDGLTASKLLGATQRLQAQLVSVAQNASGDCKATTQELATAVREDETASHAIHDDLQSVDIGSLNHDMEIARVAVDRTGRLYHALIRACR